MNVDKTVFQKNVDKTGSPLYEPYDTESVLRIIRNDDTIIHET